MATRSKSLLFLQYRSSFARSNRTTARQAHGVDYSENAGLIDNEVGQASEVVVEMSALPPKWVDIVDEVRQHGTLREYVMELESIQKKRLLPGFDDRIGDEQSIDRISDQIAIMFQDCQRRIKKVHQESKSAASKSKQAEAITRNIQMSLASKLQDVSSSFRKTQSAYLNKLRGQESRSKDMFSSAAADAMENDDDQELDSVFTDSQLATISNNEREISEREKAINDIAKSIFGLTEIFKELQTMVIDQGTLLDRIDYNIEQVHAHVEDAHTQLLQGAKYQNRTRAKLCIIFLGLFVALFIIIIIIKLSSRKRV
ncbi:t-SNARE [Chytridium lagenaria]|nr:t-SNARE [Chytridium lagenaria]